MTRFLKSAALAIVTILGVHTTPSFGTNTTGPTCAEWCEQLCDYGTRFPCYEFCDYQYAGNFSDPGYSNCYWNCSLQGGACRQECEESHCSGWS